MGERKMINFLQWTAWSMEKPKAYGSFHLLFFLIGLTVLTGLAFLLRNSNERQNKIVLLSVGIFLALSELYKQLFYTFVIGGGEYQWWIFPFQLCSVPLYLCLIAPLLKKDKIQNGMYNFMLAFNLMGGFIAFLEPSGLVHEYWTLTLHAFIWHLMLVFVGLYLGFSRRAGRQFKDFASTVATFLGLCVLAFCINLIFWNVSKGDINMFFIGPKISPLIVFKTIASNYGWYVNTLFYIPCLCLGAFLFYAPFCIWNARTGRQKAESFSVREKKTLVPVSISIEEVTTK